MDLPSEEDLKHLAAQLPVERFASLIDHTDLSPIATHEDIQRLCVEAQEMGAASVCIHQDYVLYAHQQLADSQVRVCSVIGFPFGAETPKVKAQSAADAFANGADEVDMVIDLSSAIEKDFDVVRRGIQAVVRERDEFNKRHRLLGADRRRVKVIIETCYLLEKELIQEVCRIAKEERADFVKSSTGFGRPKDHSIPKGATFEFISWMREAVGEYNPSENPVGVKASGGIGDARTALKMLFAAGILRKGRVVEPTELAVRIGASKGKDLVIDFREHYT